MRAGRYHAAQREHEGKLRRIEAEMKKTLGGRNRAGLAMVAASQARQRKSSNKVAALASVATESGILQREASILAKDGQAILGEAKDIKGAVVEAIGENDPRMAAKVEKLMDKVSQQQQAVMRADQEVFGRDLSHTHVRSRKSALVQNRNAMSKAKKLSAELADASRSERQVLRSDAELLHEEDIATNRIKRELSHVDREAALEVEHLMKQATSEQRRVVRQDLRAAKVASHLQALSHRSHRHAHRASMTQYSTSASAAARFSRFGHRLQQSVSRKRALAHMEGRVVRETAAAESAVKRTLRGTRVGAQVFRLLDRARRAARDSEMETRKGATLEGRELRSVMRLAEAMH